MAKQDDPSGATLADALAAPLAAGSLESALQAARTFFWRHPGDEDAKRAVEAIELLMAQVWFGGAEEGEEPDARLAAAAGHLARADLAAALELYEAFAADGALSDRARRLALHARVLRAAASGTPLPAPEVAPSAVVSAPVFADDVSDAMPAYAFADEAEPSPEATRHLMLGDYEILEDAPEEERTRIHTPKAAAAVASAPGAEPPPDREVTRIAGAGELPLEELRRQMEAEADHDIDALLGAVELPARAAQPSATGPLLAEASLIDVDVEELEECAELDGPTLSRRAAPAPPVAIVGRPPAAPHAPAPLDDERPASVPDAPRAVERVAGAPEPAPEPQARGASDPGRTSDLGRTAASRSEASLPFAPLPAPTTLEARPHRPSSPNVAGARPSAPPVERASVPAPPPAPAPVGVSASVPLTPPAPVPVVAPSVPAPPPAPAPVGVPPSVPAPPPAPAPVGVPPSAPPPPPAPAPVGVAPSAPLGVAPSAPAQLTVPRPGAAAAPRRPAVPAAPRGPAVPAPPRGPAVPPPPAGAATPASSVTPVTYPAASRADAPAASTDPVHALDSMDVSLPMSGPAWQIREPGAEHERGTTDDSGLLPSFADNTWTGVRTYSAAATFEPGLPPVGADTWDELPADELTPEQRAEAHLARGELSEALRLYQELAVQRPGEPDLWDRVAEIARLMQERSR